MNADDDNDIPRASGVPFAPTEEIPAKLVLTGCLWSIETTTNTGQLAAAAALRETVEMSAAYITGRRGAGSNQRNHANAFKRRRSSCSSISPFCSLHAARIRCSPLVLRVEPAPCDLVLQMRRL